MRAFSGDTTVCGAPVILGNECQVALLEAPAAAPGSGDSTRCHTWTIDERCAGVQCWSASGRPIACCGHGLLSCASLWLAKWRGDGRLLAGAQEIACSAREGRTWLGFPVLEAIPRKVPDWLPPLLAATPLHCAGAGGDAGYLVAELDPDTQLENLPAPGAALADHSARALIVTCRVAGAQAICGEDIHFRYFAPQYGVPEDTATGSAMRVLAHYWQQRGLGDELRAVQRSRDGGLLLSRQRDGRTWVGGRVEMDLARQPPEAAPHA